MAPVYPLYPLLSFLTADRTAVEKIFSGSSNSMENKVAEGNVHFYGGGQ
jgi:hypothetical protein